MMWNPKGGKKKKRQTQTTWMDRIYGMMGDIGLLKKIGGLGKAILFIYIDS